MLGIFSITIKLLKMSYSPSIQSISWNNKTLTVTSFIYNDGSAYSPWIDHSLGDKAVFRKRSDLDLIISLNNFHNFTLSHSLLKPVCSIELLAFIQLDPLHYKTPTIGNSTLSFKDEEIICYHRTMYGRWYAGKSSDRYNYWPTVVFCPIAAEDRSLCKLIANEQGSFTYKIKVKKKWWESSFKPHRKTMLDVTAKVNSSHIYIHIHNILYMLYIINVHVRYINIYIHTQHTTLYYTPYYIQTRELT